MTDTTARSDDISSSAHSKRFVASVDLPVSVEEAFAYHERPGCLNRLIPPWESVEVEKSDGNLAVGSRAVVKMSVAGVPFRWHARHTDYAPPDLFADEQESGPFSFWRHRHRFASTGPKSSRLTDDIEYRIPLGQFGRMLGGTRIRDKIDAMFAYRHRVTHDDLTLAARYRTDPLTIAVSGATGLVGGGLCNLLGLLGHRVLKITRDEQGNEGEIAAWASDEEFQRFNDVDVVVHLAGKPIAGSRWTAEIKEQIRDSRVEMTRSLCERLARLSGPPHTLICASATGFYGDRGDEMLSESSSPGDDFLADVCQEWEAACQPVLEAGVRVVNTRFGMVISPRGGALKKMLTPAKMCGGALGSGRQYWSWIALDDVLGGIVHAIETPQLSGPVNFVSPTPMSNREFARTLGRVLDRPALFPAPAGALRWAVGEMADALLLASSRVLPEKLAASGYEFRFSSLRELLRYSLGVAKIAELESDRSARLS